MPRRTLESITTGCARGSGSAPEPPGSAAADGRKIYCHLAQQIRRDYEFAAVGFDDLAGDAIGVLQSDLIRQCLSRQCEEEKNVLPR